MSQLTEFSSFFREAAPYIHQYRGKIFVIGLSGASCEADNLPTIAQDIALLSGLGIQVVLVHGAREQIERSLKQHNVQTVVQNDTRITNAEALELIKREVGALRFDIEAALSMALPNTPMAGSEIHTVSGNYITARPYGVLDGVDMLFSGQVRKVDTDSIRQHLNLGFIAMMGSIGYSLSGETFNLKMEEVASKVAIELKAEKLLYLIKGKGIVDYQEERISTLSAQRAADLLEDNRSSEETRRILAYAIKAVDAGVNRVQILPAFKNGAILDEIFTRAGVGTSIAREAFEQIREARLADIPSIMSIIQPLEEKGILLKRSREYIENHVQQFLVLENDTLIHACVAFQVYSGCTKMAELSCLAVAPFAQTEGYGQQMLQYVEQKAKAEGVEKLFILTTQTAHWFMERGFAETTLQELPVDKQKQYNYARNSKIFIKNML